MSRNLFRTRLREFAVAEIGKPGQHPYAEIAARFLVENPLLAEEYMRQLAGVQVSRLVKDLCDEPADFGQPDLFGGFPAAITVSDGVVKASQNCTIDDLGAGLEYRRQNARRAQERMAAYVRSMQLFDGLRERDDETVGEVADRVKNRKKKA